MSGHSRIEDDDEEEDFQWTQNTVRNGNAEHSRPFETILDPFADLTPHGDDADSSMVDDAALPGMGTGMGMAAVLYGNKAARVHPSEPYDVRYPILHGRINTRDFSYQVGETGSFLEWGERRSRRERRRIP